MRNTTILSALAALAMLTAFAPTGAAEIPPELNDLCWQDGPPPTQPECYEACDDGYYGYYLVCVDPHETVCNALSRGEGDAAGCAVGRTHAESCDMVDRGQGNAVGCVANWASEGVQWATFGRQCWNPGFGMPHLCW